MSHKITMPKDHQYTTVPVSEGVVRVRSKGHEDPFVVSRSGFVSYQQFIEGCTTLVSRSHCQHVDNGVTFGMIEQVGQYPDFRSGETLAELSLRLTRAHQSCVWADTRFFSMNVIIFR